MSAGERPRRSGWFNRIGSPSALIFVEPGSDGTRTVMLPGARLGARLRGPFARPSDLVEGLHGDTGIEAAFLRTDGSGTWLEVLAGWDRVLAFGARPTDADATDDLAPWQRPGWLRDATRTIDDALAGSGTTRSGPVRQTHQGSFNAILEVPTGSASLWFKALPAFFAHEPRIIRILARRHPERVPTILAEGDDWWIAAPFAPPRARPGDPYAALARLHQDGADLVAAAADAGVPRLDLEDLPAIIAQGATEPSVGLSSETAERLLDGVSPLRRLCAEAAALGFGDCLLHGDFHPGNRRWTERGWLFFDWTDSRIGWPFLDLAMADRFESDRAREAALHAYQSAWLRRMAPGRVARAAALARLLAPAGAAAGYLRIVAHTTGTMRREAAADAAFWLRRLLAAGTEPSA